MRWFRFLAFRPGTGTGVFYSLTQVVFSSKYLAASRVSTRMQSLPLITSRSWIAESILRPVAGKFCMLRGGLRSRISKLLSVSASSAINTFIFITSLTACCRAARLSIVGFVTRAGRSSPLPVVLQPVIARAHIRATNASWIPTVIAAAKFDWFARSTSE